jgi:hypothetical protein
VPVFEFNGLHDPGGKIRGDRGIRQTGKQPSQLPIRIMKRLVVHHTELKTGVRPKLRVFFTLRPVKKPGSQPLVFQGNLAQNEEPPEIP